MVFSGSCVYCQVGSSHLTQNICRQPVVMVARCIANSEESATISPEIVREISPGWGSSCSSILGA